VGLAITFPAGIDPAVVRYCWGAAPICNVFDTDQPALPAFTLPLSGKGREQP